VFENRMLRRMFGPRRYEVTGDSRRLHNVELHNLYFLSNIIRMANSMRMKWTGHVAQIGRRVMHTSYWLESQRERDN
jgi:hypothetical protein